MKILYVSCHSILEFDEIRMFDDIGHSVFSTGADIYPIHESCGYERPIINFKHWDIDDYNCWEEQTGVNHFEKLFNLKKEFVDRFDVIFINGSSHYLQKIWEKINHKTVIFRTIGQSNSSSEASLRNYKKNGNLKIVRYSPNEQWIPNYAGEDALIRFGKRKSEWDGWVGCVKSPITVSQYMMGRGEICSYKIFKEIHEKIPSILYGQTNELAPMWNGFKLKWYELNEVYQKHRAYISLGTKPASYTLNFIEAWMTGIPVVVAGVAIGADATMPRVYEVPDLIEHGENGFCANTTDEFVSIISNLLENDNLSVSISKKGRNSAIKYFDEDLISGQWKDFFNSL